LGKNGEWWCAETLSARYMFAFEKCDECDESDEFCCASACGVDDLSERSTGSHFEKCDESDECDESCCMPVCIRKNLY